MNIVAICNVFPVLSPTSSIGTHNKNPMRHRKDQQKLMPFFYLKGVFWDYLELFLQFGYVFLFSSVYPMAAFWALFNNVFELRTDAFKIAKISQRVFAQPSQGIGAWQVQ